MKTTKRFLLTLAAMIGMTGAWAQSTDEYVDVTPAAAANQWTFTMPDADVELEVEYCTIEEWLDLGEALQLTKVANGEWTLDEMPACDLETEIEYETALALNEVDDNAAALTKWDGYEADVTLTRTLQTGGWNTLCVPFDLDIPTGWTVKELTSSAFADGTLTLTFADAASIVAGKPYLVKVDAAVASPTFDGVTVSKTAVTTETTYADFVPVFSPTNLTGGDKNILFVTGGNTLTYPAADGNINGFRAYFYLKGDAVAEARAFRMSFGDASGIEEIDDLPIDDLRFASGIYTLDGRRIAGQPTQKGVYIVNGKKTIIK